MTVDFVCWKSFSKQMRNKESYPKEKVSYTFQSKTKKKKASSESTALTKQTESNAPHQNAPQMHREFVAVQQMHRINETNGRSLRPIT